MRESMKTIVGEVDKQVVLAGTVGGMKAGVDLIRL